MKVLWALFVYCAVAFSFGALLNTYTINTWLTYCGKTPSVLWWHGGLIGLATNALIVPAALITWVCQLFLV